MTPLGQRDARYVAAYAAPNGLVCKYLTHPLRYSKMINTITMDANQSRAFARLVMLAYASARILRFFTYPIPWG